MMTTSGGDGLRRAGRLTVEISAMRRARLIAGLMMASLIGCVGMSACTASDSDAVDSDAVAANADEPSEAAWTPEPEPDPTTIQPAVTVDLAHVLGGSVELDDGYSYSVQVELTDWVKGTDQESLDAGWAGVGGRGLFSPPTDDANGMVMSGNWGSTSYVLWDPAKIAVVFGHARITNTTASFSLGPGEASASVHNWYSGEGNKAYIGNGNMAGGREENTGDIFSSEGTELPGAHCISFSNVDMACGTELPRFSNNNTLPPGESVTWAFAIIVGDVFNPSDPNGTALVGVSFGVSSDLLGNRRVTEELITPGRLW